MTLASGGWQSDLPTCGPLASFPIYLVSSAFTPARPVHKSRGDNVVCMWIYDINGSGHSRRDVRRVEGIVVMDVICHRLCVSMLYLF